MACGAPTNGIFTKADKIIARAKAKRMKEANVDGEEDEQTGSDGIPIENGD
jgi:RING finger protein 113A